MNELTRCGECNHYPIEKCKAKPTDPTSCNGCPCFNEPCDICDRGIGCNNNTTYSHFKDLAKEIRETKFEPFPDGTVHDDGFDDYLHSLTKIKE